MGTTVAAIDIGTNSALMVVARLGANEEIQVLADFARVTRLGRGVDGSGRLARAAMDRTLAVLEDYMREAKRQGAERVAAVGTSALRDACNRADFLDAAEKLVGCEVKVIGGHREAELTYRGARVGLSSLALSRPTVVDIGGGSTEIITALPEGGLKSRSVDVGSVRLFERFHQDDPPSPSQMRQAELHLETQLAPAAGLLQPPLVGIAGTITTLATLDQQLESYQRERLQGYLLTRQGARRQLQRIASLPTAEREQIPGLEAGRADVIVAGAQILDRILSVAGADEISVSVDGVRTGLAKELLLGSRRAAEG